MAIACGYGSFRFRRLKVQHQGDLYSAVENSQALNIVNDGVFGFFGYICGHLFSCAYIYKSRQYVLERMYLEQEQAIDRRSFLDL